MLSITNIYVIVRRLGTNKQWYRKLSKLQRRQNKGRRLDSFSPRTLKQKEVVGGGGEGLKGGRDGGEPQGQVWAKLIEPCSSSGAITSRKANTGGATVLTRGRGQLCGGGVAPFCLY